MKAFSDTLIHAGQQSSFLDTWDIKHTLPVSKKVTSALQTLADAARQDFCDHGISAVQKIGDGISTYRLKQKTTGKSFHDVRLSLFIIQHGGILYPISLALRSKILFVEERVGPATAKDMVANINTGMMRD